MTTRNLSGDSNFLGFTIAEHDENWMIIKKVNSKGYKKGLIASWGIGLSTITSTESLLAYLTILKILELPWLLISIALIILICVFAKSWLPYLFIAYIPYIGKQFRQWHGTEHRLSYLLENHKRVTLENLKVIPLNDYNCGNKNMWLEEPSEEKLEEALRISYKLQ